MAKKITKRSTVADKKNIAPARAKRDFSEIRGLSLFILAIIAFLSLISFSLHSIQTQNLLGALGYAISWTLTAFFGLSSYFIICYLSWVGWRLMFKKSINSLFLKSLYVFFAVVSSCILFNLLEDRYPAIGNQINTFFYGNASGRKISYHLGGAPFHYLYRDMPGFNLLYIFNALGIGIIFSGTLLISLLLLAKISPFALLARLKESSLATSPSSLPPSTDPEMIAKAPSLPYKALPEAPKEKEKPKEKEIAKPNDSDFLRYVKLRIPGFSSSSSATSDQSTQMQNEMLAIQPDNNLKSRPSLSNKELSEKELPLPPQKIQENKVHEPLSSQPPTVSLPPKQSVTSQIPSPTQRREAALSAQRVHNGDFSSYHLPGLNLLTTAKKLDHSSLKKDLRRKAEVLEETLLSFGIEAKVGQINCGPTITSFEVHPAIGVKVQKIKTLENDIALNMEAKSIRIIAPIPGKAAVGIEVPNAQPEEVGFKEMLAAYQQSGKKFHIPILLGKAVNGEYVMNDLTKMPHCIIAGATGSGKSVCINTIVMSILLNAKPDEIKLVMVDPKKVELTPYTRLPHMLAPVITEPQGACAALNWLVKEMEKRYELLKQIGARNIESFNGRTIDKAFEDSLGLEIPEKLPYIVGIIDELADLMMVASSDIETPIARIAQMARAVGIHLILATQRPSREVITGLIKANFPTRISFKVSSRVNSMIVLDDTGAETLLGNGDMLFLPPGSSHLIRAQGAFIRDEDINAVVKSITEQAPPRYLIESFDRIGHIEISENSEEESGDALYKQALDMVLSTGNASTTFLQRKLKIGYARAASLIDMLEKKGVVGPAEGSKPRKVLGSRGPKDDNDDILEGNL